MIMWQYCRALIESDFALFQCLNMLERLQFVAANFPTDEVFRQLLMKIPSTVIMFSI